MIFLDAVGTLFTVRGSVGDLYAQAAQAYGVEVDPNQLNRAFYQAFQSAPPAAFPGTHPNLLVDLERSWWQAVVEKTFTREGTGLFPGFADYFQQVFDLFATPAAWDLYPETVEVLQALTQRRIRLGVISNFDSRLLPVLEGLGLADYFSTVTISTQVGYAKPQAQVFQAAIEKAGVSTTESLHVGDSFSQDYVGAQQAGLQAVWLNREQEPTDPGIVQIADLSGLLRLVAQS